MSAPHRLVKCLVRLRNRNKALRDCPGCVQSLCLRYGVHLRGAVLIHTAGVRKYRLRVSAFHGVVKWLVHFQNRTPTVQGATGLSSMCTETMAEVRRPPSGRCTNPYSGCTNVLFPRKCSPWVDKVASAFSESYNHCTKRYRTA